jgi:CRISPR/Cas system CMR-associated protein Cmr5 small subunit
MHRVDQDQARAAAMMLDGITVNASLRTRYRTLRVMSHTSGLAATYAYVAARARKNDSSADAYAKVQKGLADRLVARRWIEKKYRDDPRALLQELGEMDTVDYLAASADATALLGWLARLGDALVVEDGGDQDA